MTNQIFIDIFENPVPVWVFHSVYFQFHTYYCSRRISMMPCKGINSEEWMWIHFWLARSTALACTHLSSLSVFVFNTLNTKLHTEGAAHSLCHMFSLGGYGPLVRPMQCAHHTCLLSRADLVLIKLDSLHRRSDLKQRTMMDRLLLDFSGTWPFLYTIITQEELFYNVPYSFCLCSTPDPLFLSKQYW